MNICDLCATQVNKGRYDDPHEFLRPVGQMRAYRGLPTGGYEEQDYECKKCGAKFTHSNDRYDVGWLLHK